MELFQELSEQKKGWMIQAEALLKQILVRLTRNYEKEIRERFSAGTQIPDRTAVIIEEYFLYEYQNLSLEELAGKVGLGTRQTERLLQKHYGKTFLQKKTEAKMSAAATLLSFLTLPKASPPLRKRLVIRPLNIFPLLLKNIIIKVHGSTVKV